jgi:hypothetical protein
MAVYGQRQKWARARLSFSPCLRMFFQYIHHLANYISKQVTKGWSLFTAAFV